MYEKFSCWRHRGAGLLRLSSFTALAAFVIVGALVAGCGGGGSSTGGGSTAEGENGGTAGTEGGETTTAKLTEPVVIGAAIAKSGAMQIFDEPSYAMFKLGIEDINRKGGIGGQPVKLVEANTSSTPEGAKQAAESVIQKGADVVMVTCNFDFAAPAANVAQAEGKLTFTLCAASPKFGVQGIGPLAYSPMDASQVEGAIEAKYAYDQGWKKAFVLEDNSIDYGQEIADGFRQGFEAVGGEIVGEASFKNEDRSIASQITQMKGSGAEVISDASYAPGGASAIRQIRAAGINTPIMGTIGLDGTYWTSAVPNLNDYCGTGTISLAGDNPKKEVNSLLTRYEKATGEPLASSLGAAGYADAEIIADAIEKAGSTEGEALAEALDEFDEVPTLLGPISYTPELHIQTKQPMAVSCYTNGKPKLAEYVSPPEGIEIGLEG